MHSRKKKKLNFGIKTFDFQTIFNERNFFRRLCLCNAITKSFQRATVSIVIMHFPHFFSFIVVVASCQITSHLFLSFVQFFYVLCRTSDSGCSSKKSFICIKLHFYCTVRSGRWKIYCRTMMEYDWKYKFYRKSMWRQVQARIIYTAICSSLLEIEIQLKCFKMFTNSISTSHFLFSFVNNKL